MQMYQCLWVPYNVNTFLEKLAPLTPRFVFRAIEQRINGRTVGWPIQHVKKGLGALPFEGTLSRQHNPALNWICHHEEGAPIANVLLGDNAWYRLYPLQVQKLFRPILYNQPRIKLAIHDQEQLLMCSSDLKLSFEECYDFHKVLNTPFLVSWTSSAFSYGALFVSINILLDSTVSEWAIPISAIKHLGEVVYVNTSLQRDTTYKNPIGLIDLDSEGSACIEDLYEVFELKGLAHCQKPTGIEKLNQFLQYANTHLM